MKESHVELIDPLEKLSPELGGTDYVGPKEAASAFDLYTNALSTSESFPDLNMTVWKVLRSSVAWNKYAKSRRLKINGRVIQCEIIGSTRDWWFVSVDAIKAAKILSP